MKIPLQLNVFSQATFLNFWDRQHGNDVVCEIRDGVLYRSNGDGPDDDSTMTLAEFVVAVKASAGDTP